MLLDLLEFVEAAGCLLPVEGLEAAHFFSEVLSGHAGELT